MRSWFAVVVTLALCGCPDDRPLPPEDDDGGMKIGSWPDGAVVIGVTDESDYSYLEMTAETELHNGAQGGFHVPAAYKITGQTAPGAQFDHKVRRVSDNALLSRGSRVFDVAPGDGGVFIAPEITIFLCPTPVGLSASDELVRFEVVITGQDGGTLGSATHETTLRCPSGNSFCQSICKG